MLFTCDAVLFDLDGVLVDSSAVVERSWRAWAACHSLDAERVLQTAHGRRTVETVRALLPDVDAKTEAAQLAKREAEDTEGLRVVSGVADLLHALPTYRWAIVTSGQRAVATARLRYAQLPQANVFITAEDVTNGKPAPEAYLRAAHDLGYAPSACLVFEDAPAGLRAAQTAGATTVGVTTSYPPDALQPAATHVPDFDAVYLDAVTDDALRIRCA